MSETPFGLLPDGEPVEAVRLTGGGLTATFLTWGAVLHDLRLDGHGPALVLALPDLDAYLAHSRYFGATAGRCANRIANGHAVIDGEATTSTATTSANTRCTAAVTAAASEALDASRPRRGLGPL